MAETQFSCPKCGGPIAYKETDPPIIPCPFCATPVKVPREIRRAASVRPATVSQVPIGRILALVMGVIAIITLCSILGPVLGIFAVTGAITQGLSPAIDKQFQAVDTKEAVDKSATRTAVAPTRTPVSSPTPGFARPTLHFGSSGTGPGMLDHSDWIAVDDSGNVYLGDNRGGRVQIFSAEGEYLRALRVGGQDAAIHGMAVSRDGIVYVSLNRDIMRYDGATGKLLGKLANPSDVQASEFGDLVLTPDGGIAAVWYEGRWGVIDSLDGHRDDLVYFDASGNIARTVTGFVTTRKNDPAVDVSIAIDSKGTVFALDEGEVYIYSAEGKFKKSFHSVDHKLNDLLVIDRIQVDAQDHLLAASKDRLLIYSQDGKMLKWSDMGIDVACMAVNAQGEVYATSGDEVVRYKIGALP